MRSRKSPFDSKVLAKWMLPTGATKLEIGRISTTQACSTIGRLFGMKEKISQAQRPIALVEALELAERGYLLVNKNGLVQEMNAWLRTDLGYEETEVRQLSILIIYPTLNLLAWQAFWKRLETEPPIEEEAQFITKEGVVYPVKLKAQWTKQEGITYCCFIVFNQLTVNRYLDLLYLTTQISKTLSWEYDLMHQEVLVATDNLDFFGKGRRDLLLEPMEVLRYLRKKVGPAETLRLIQAIRLGIREGKELDVEFRLLQGAGSLQTLKIQGIPAQTKTHTSKFFGIAQDISTISNRSEEMYLSQFTLDQSKDLIFWLRKDGTIYYSNYSARKKLGYSREELEGSSMLGLIKDLGAEAWQQLWQQVRRSGLMEQEARLLPKSGKSIPVAQQLSYLQYENEALLCVIASDIAEKKHRDEMLQLARYTLDNSRDMIFWTVQTGLVIYHNQRAADVLGYSAEEFKTLNLFDVLKDLDEETGTRIWEDMLQHNYAEFEQEVYCKDGRHFPMFGVVTPFLYGGQTCACVIWRDVSKSKARTRMLEKALTEITELKEQLEEEKEYLEGELSAGSNFSNIISQSKSYQGVLHQVSQVAVTDSTVLILGETGTGKELLARAIHAFSNRSDRQLIKINCAGFPASLIESELFGHEKGAFTGAYKQKKGRFELADGGTLLLDEIGEMPLELQPKLLRVLQEGEFERVGGTETIKVDVRIIAATNRDLLQMTEAGKFRVDLYYRLNVFPIYNIPLRERRADIPLLVQFFMEKFSERTAKAITKIQKKDLEDLMAYAFPGNIRELENLIERAVILSTTEVLNIRAVMPSNSSAGTGAGTSEFLTFEKMQRQHIVEALNRTNWRITGDQGAAKLLGLNGKTLYSKMKKLGIERKDF